MEVKHYLMIACVVAFLLSTFLDVYFSRKSKKQSKAVSLAKVVQQIPSAICEAERLFTSPGSGPAKLSYVLGKLELACTRIGVSYEDNVEGLKAEVENVLEAPQKK